MNRRPRSVAKAPAPTPAAAADYLRSFDWEMRYGAVEERVIKGGLPLWIEIVRLVPQPARRGRLLELGSPPFHTTLLVQKHRNYDIATTAAASDNRRLFQHRLASKRYAEEHTFDCPCFDIEREFFPFPDDAFDVVMFCEVIEHLTENPVFALREIHRVLKPGGAAVISTPNAARSGNIMRLWLGANVFDLYHLGAVFRGSRHSHEYTMRELRALLTGCGFRLEAAYGRNLGQTQFVAATRPLEPVFRAFAMFGRGVHSDYLFVRARKEGPFRWAFPADLFERAQLQWYMQPCDSILAMGSNDIPHTGPGWGELETGADGRAWRWANQNAVVCLRTSRPSRQVTIEAMGAKAGGPVRVEVFGERLDRALQLTSADFRPPAESWSALEIPLPADLPAGHEIWLRILAPAGVAVHRATVE